MTVKTFLQELAHTGGKALGRVGAAAVEVLRDSGSLNSEETDLEQYTRETRDYYLKSPNGDGRYDLDPNGVRDSL